MDSDLIVTFGILGFVCITVLVGLLLVLLMWRSSRVAVEKEKTDRILQTEELKLERTRLTNEKSAIYANRDIVSAQLEAGILGNASGKNTDDDESGLGGILKNVLPLLMQNPEMLSKLTGFLRPGSTVAQAPGGEVPSSGTFPVSESVNA